MALSRAAIRRIRSLNAKVWEALHIAHLFERAGDFDLIHNQADFMPLIFSRMVETPIVTTIHGFSSPTHPAGLSALQRPLRLCRDQRRRPRIPSLNYAATIHHGIPIDEFPFDPVGSEDLLFFGRFHPDKGAGEAIRAARAAGRRLVMAGIVQDADYFATRSRALHRRTIASIIAACWAATTGPARWVRPVRCST